MKTVIGLDIGGTKIYGALFALPDFTIIKEIHKSTLCHDTKNMILKEICTCINELRNETTEAIGISFAGMIDKKTHMIVRAPNIPQLDQADLRGFVEEYTHIPTRIGNDASLFTLAEALFGAGKGKNPILGLTFGTGLGAGLVIDQKIYEGAQGFSMEPGHTSFGGRIPELEKEYGLEGWYRYIEKQTGQPSPHYFQEAYRSWNETTASLFRPRVEELSLLLKNFILLFNPEVIIIGGGVGQYLFPLLLPHIMAEVQHQLEAYQLPQICSLTVSASHNAGALGAAYLAYSDIFSS